jgi:hypothetical protein
LAAASAALDHGLAIGRFLVDATAKSASDNVPVRNILPPGVEVSRGHASNYNRGWGDDVDRAARIARVGHGRRAPEENSDSSVVDQSEVHGEACLATSNTRW